MPSYSTHSIGIDVLQIDEGIQQFGGIPGLVVIERILVTERS